MSTSEPAPPMNHVFVDFENGQKIDPALVGNKAVSLVLLIGEKQKISVGLVKRLMEHAQADDGGSSGGVDRQTAKGETFDDRPERCGDIFPEVR